MPVPSQGDPQGELLTEYYKLIDMIQGYDPYFISIKSWSATLGSLAIGTAFTRPATTLPLLGAAILLSVSFWVVEAVFKILQQNHVIRAGLLEHLLQQGGTTPTPRILQSFAEAAVKNRQNRAWRRVMLWPHVAFPHALFALVALIAGTLAIGAN
jgi:hypothetical protein